MYESGEVSLSCKSLSDISFDSNFECGNLEYVVSDNLTKLDLYIKPESNTHGHFQWFYFKVKSRVPKKIILVIKNFLKAKMLYRTGLRPYYQSNMDDTNCWRQIESNCTYQKNLEEEDHY